MRRDGVLTRMIHLGTTPGTSVDGVHVTRRDPRSGRNPYDANNSEEKNPVYNAYTGVNGQVNKSIRRMPWHWEPKKDVISCEKLR